MKKPINTVHLSGLLYEHDLALKTTGNKSKKPGTPFISGTISIATDDAITNIVQVHFTCVTAITAKGTPNATFSTLNAILEGKVQSVMEHGKENAVKIKCDTAVGLNEFYTDRNGKEELVSVKRNEGGFVHIVNEIEADEKARNRFDTDIVITGVVRKEADEEKNIPEKVIVRGAIFDFKKRLLPVEFEATNPRAMDYFEGLEASAKEPVFTKVWGRQISTTVIVPVSEENAWGEINIKQVPRTYKGFVITGANPVPYNWDDESTITAEEVKAAIQQRELDLAALKKSQDEYKASKAMASAVVVPSEPVVVPSAPKAGNFVF